MAKRAAAAAVELYWGSGVCDDVPALAWFLVVALIPLALGMTALASILLGDYAQAQALAARAAGALPTDVGDQLVQLLLRTRRDSPLLLAGSIIAMVWACSGAVGVLERSMSRLLDRERFGPFTGKLRHLALAAALTLVVVLVVLAGSKATRLPGRMGLDGTGVAVAVSVAATAATALVCAAVYRSAPREGIAWWPALVGAVPAAAGLQLMPTAVGYYLTWVAGTTPVHVFLLLAGVLFTCWLSALSLLIGAAIAARGHLAGAHEITRSG